MERDHSKCKFANRGAPCISHCGDSKGLVPRAMSYHDVSVEWGGRAPELLFNLPFNLMLTCTRCGGWELYDNVGQPTERLLAGEYNDAKLIVRVAGEVICGDRD